MALPKLHDWERMRVALRQLHESLRSARLAQIPEVRFNVVEADPRHAEKRALPARLARPQDRRRRALPAEFLNGEFCLPAENPSTLRPTRRVARAKYVRPADTAFSVSETPFKAPLAQAIGRLQEREPRALMLWARQRLAGYPE